jgi:hypothetical protein
MRVRDASQRNQRRGRKTALDADQIESSQLTGTTQSRAAARPWLAFAAEPRFPLFDASAGFLPRL